MRIESVGICIEIVSRNQAPRTRNPEYSAMTFPPKVIYFHVVATTTTTTKATARTRPGSTDCFKRDMLLISLRGTFSSLVGWLRGVQKNLHRYWEIVTVMGNDGCVQRTSDGVNGEFSSMMIVLPFMYFVYLRDNETRVSKIFHYRDICWDLTVEL